MDWNGMLTTFILFICLLMSYPSACDFPDCDTTLVQDELVDIRSLCAARFAFAALRDDGQVIAWGDHDMGGQSSCDIHMYPWCTINYICHVILITLHQTYAICIYMICISNKSKENLQVLPTCNFSFRWSTSSKGSPSQCDGFSSFSLGLCSTSQWPDCRDMGRPPFRWELPGSGGAAGGGRAGAPGWEVDVCWISWAILDHTHGFKIVDIQDDLQECDWTKGYCFCEDRLKKFVWYVDVILCYHFVNPR